MICSGLRRPSTSRSQLVVKLRFQHELMQVVGQATEFLPSLRGVKVTHVIKLLETAKSHKCRA